VSPARSGPRRWLPFAVAAGVAVAVVLFVVLAGGGGGDTAIPGPAAPAPSGPAPGGGSAVTSELGTGDRAEALALGRRMVRPVAQRDPAPQVRVQTAAFGDGTVFDLSAQRGNVVVLYFTAAWCPTCTAETRALARIQEAHAAHGVRILALDVDWTETEDDLEAYRGKYGNGRHLWAMDEDLTVAQAYGIRSLGSTVFIDREGRVAYSDSLQTSYETLNAVIEALLQ
jgi:peroxiredoxin